MFLYHFILLTQKMFIWYTKQALMEKPRLSRGLEFRSKFPKKVALGDKVGSKNELTVKAYTVKKQGGTVF